MPLLTPKSGQPKRFRGRSGGSAGQATPATRLPRNLRAAAQVGIAVLGNGTRPRGHGDSPPSSGDASRQLNSVSSELADLRLGVLLSIVRSFLILHMKGTTHG